MKMNAMSDGLCGTIGGEKPETPNECIARLNGTCKPLDRSHECPFRCKSYYMQMMIESMKSMIECMYAENLIDLETMEREILSVRNEKKC